MFAFIDVLAEPAYADPMALWNIVTRQCVPQFEKGEALIPPCEHVDIAGGKDRGYVYFKDRIGVAQMLTLPIRRLTGIEEPALLEPDAPNYFAGAWAARAYVEAHLHRSLPREAVAISVNSMVRRSQDQLHFHVDCVDNDVATTLAEYKDRLDSQWRPMSVALEGRHYWARRLDSPDLSDISPFRLLADGVDGAKDRMGLWTLSQSERLSPAANLVLYCWPTMLRRAAVTVKTYKTKNAQLRRLNNDPGAVNL